MSFDVVKAPCAYMRNGPLGEVVSQVVFGENVSTLETRKDEWSKIKTDDGFVGWVQSEAFFYHEKNFETNVKVTALRALIYTGKETQLGELNAVPFGSRMRLMEYNDNSKMVKVQLPNLSVGFIRRSDVQIEPTEQSSLLEVLLLSERFVGLPYAQGGRSSFGIDSSGFSQLLCRQMGVIVERGVKEQLISDKFHTIRWEETKPGDFIFLTRINEIGFYLGNGQVISAVDRRSMSGVSLLSIEEFQSPLKLESLETNRIVRRLKGIE